MRNANKIAALLLLSLFGSTVSSAIAAEKCEIDSRQSKAVGESAAKRFRNLLKLILMVSLMRPFLYCLKQMLRMISIKRMLHVC